MESSGTPDRLPQGGPQPICWRADYSSEGEAAVWVCGYRISGSAFEALQHMRAGAQEVKFQKGLYLVVVQWKNVSQTGVTALVSALQKRLPD